MDGSKQLRLITFVVGEESFVLDIMSVRQIVMYSGSTPVPKAPSFIEGIIVLRNDVIPIIDLRRRLFPDRPPGDQTPLVLILRSPVGLIGLKVDGVRRIITVDADSILPPPPLIRDLQGELFIGVVPREGEVFLLLDLETLLTAEEKVSLRETEFKIEEERGEKRPETGEQTGS